MVDTGRQQTASFVDIEDCISPDYVYVMSEILFRSFLSTVFASTAPTFRACSAADFRCAGGAFDSCAAASIPHTEGDPL
jgi:hypothetical protein